MLSSAGGFKSGEQWQVIGSQGRRGIVFERNGERPFLPLAQASKFTLFRAETVALSVGDTARITKNFRIGGIRFRNNELHAVTTVEASKQRWMRANSRTAAHCTWTRKLWSRATRASVKPSGR